MQMGVRACVHASARADPMDEGLCCERLQGLLLRHFFEPPVVPREHLPTLKPSYRSITARPPALPPVDLSIGASAKLLSNFLHGFTRHRSVTLRTLLSSISAMPGSSAAAFGIRGPSNTTCVAYMVMAYIRPI